MALSYELQNSLKALAPVLDGHAEWFGGVVRCLFYPENAQGQMPTVPHSFAKWMETASRADFGAATLEDLVRIHDQLHKAAAGMMAETFKTGQKPEQQLFDALIELYDDFLTRMRRLERDSVLADSGIDVMTGLRSRRAMDKDLERELERRSRQGKPFCIVLARIDNLEFNRSERFHDALKEVAALVKKSVRSFDDAYRSGEAEFIMALKHTETAGGTAAIARLKKFLKEKPIMINVGGQRVPLTMSYCTAEPLPGDNLEVLLSHMRSDLSRYDEGAGDTLVEYIEQSPLERFIQGLPEPV